MISDFTGRLSVRDYVVSIKVAPKWTRQPFDNLFDN